MLLRFQSNILNISLIMLSHFPERKKMNAIFGGNRYNGVGR
ncbi:hypothetical protein B4099_0332 [Heyndrickxia coagulans]|uniref:Uncharacterized protein n=1 Tax=Heyndrickxia coagulans TaxID=1398 RepID=A0A150KEY4_HEYCO|nr:hypothetical protein B4099_0332 [Heyndrickxia coagulans]